MPKDEEEPRWADLREEELAARLLFVSGGKLKRKGQVPRIAGTRSEFFMAEGGTKSMP